MGKEYLRKWRQQNQERFNKYKRDYYHGHLEEQRRHQREYLHSLRMKSMNILGGKCIRCGFSDWRTLQFDHINGGGTKENKTIGLIGIHKKVLSDSKDYQLLCANCNWIKRYENKEVTKRKVY